MANRALLLLLLILILAGCGDRVGSVQKEVPGGDPAQGQAALVAYGCGACHTIPGIPGAVAVVGPSLEDYEQHHYIAGNLPNTTDNLIYWLQEPQAVEPGTAMPDLGVTQNDARNMAAYLFQ